MPRPLDQSTMSALGLRLVALLGASTPPVTADELARRLGVRPTTVSDYFRRGTLRPATVRAIAEALGCDPSAIDPAVAAMADRRGAGRRNGGESIALTLVSYETFARVAGQLDRLERSVVAHRNSHGEGESTAADRRLWAALERMRKGARRGSGGGNGPRKKSSEF